MSIQRKLTLLLSVLGILLALLAGLMVWNAAQITVQMRSIRAEMGHFQSLGKLRVLYYRQMHLSAHYLVFGGEDSRADFDMLGREIDGLFKVMQQDGNRDGGPDAGPDGPKSIEIGYRRVIGIVQKAFALRDRGRIKEAMELIDKEAEPISSGIFMKKIDALMARHVQRIEDDYDETILRLGAMPWHAREDLKVIEGARSAIRYYYTVDDLTRLVNSQVKELLDFLITGTDENKREIDVLSAQVKRALADWESIIHYQSLLDVEGEEEDLKLMRTVERVYYDILESMQIVLAKGSAGQQQEAIRALDSKTMFMIDNIMLSTLDAALYDSRQEIDHEHDLLVSSTMTNGVIGMLVIIAAALVLLFVSHRFIRTTIRGIGALKEGAELVGSGDLNHRIPVHTRDELGDLAASFNRMTASLQDGNEDLRSFIYSLSHDLRSPLVNIKGFTGELQHTLKELEKLLERNCGHLATDDRARLQAMLKSDLPGTMGFIGSAAVRINELVNAVLKLSLIGQRDAAPGLIDMTELVRSAADRLGEEIRRRKVTVRIADLPSVTADRADMEEIIANILDNALKYRVSDRQGDVEITGQRTNGEVVYRFRDNGRGIASEDLVRIFGLFRRAGQQDIPGDGMGLAYVKALVRRNRGRVWCESEPGVGTTFHVAIPDAKTNECNRP